MSHLDNFLVVDQVAHLTVISIVTSITSIVTLFTIVLLGRKKMIQILWDFKQQQIFVFLFHENFVKMLEILLVFS